MINAVFSSKVNGTKAFELDDVNFGWNSICSMYKRECDRVENGSTRMVPKLKEIHIIRDSWTKLNVTPAKIMQVSWYTNLFINCLSYVNYSKNTYCLSCTNILMTIQMQEIQYVRPRQYGTWRRATSFLKGAF